MLLAFAIGLIVVLALNCMCSWLKKREIGQTDQDQIIRRSRKSLKKRGIKQTDHDNEKFNCILSLIQNCENVFITGGAGVGKSYTLSKLKELYKEKLHITSTTGISAINVGGQTLHSWSGIGIGNKPIEDIIKKIKKKPTLYKTLICCRMLAIDEISMLDNLTFDYVNEVLKRVRENSKPFGGIQVLIFGDFFNSLQCE